MHLLKPLALFLAASKVTNASSGSNLLEPLSKFLAAGSSALENNIGEGRRLAATYGPSISEKMEGATHSVRNGVAAYGQPVWKKLGEVTDSARTGAAAYSPPVWEKAEEGIQNVCHTPPFICHQMLILHQAAQWSAANPVPATCAAVGVGGAIAVAAPGIVSASILSSAGFGATGVQASKC